MDYKEKLRLAKEALESGSYDKETIEYIFPELAESEDERMEKAIIATIHLYYGEPLEDEAKEMIAWLEKQGQSIVWSEEDKKMFKLTENLLLVTDSNLSANQNGRITPLADGEYSSLKIQIAQSISWLRILKDKVLPQPKQEWSEEDEKHQLHTISLIEDIKDWANKDGMHSLCIERCIESIDWLILLKERCCPQIGDYHEGFEKGFAKAKAMNCHWTPSDEQIEALDTIINHVVTKTSYFDALEDLNYRNLEKLCNDLKKLREE